MAELVGERHQHVAADARLDVLLGHVRRGAREVRRQRPEIGRRKTRVMGMTRNCDAQVVGQRARVV